LKENGCDIIEKLIARSIQLFETRMSLIYVYYSKKKYMC